MPVVISSNKLYVKKEDGSGYLPANVIAAETTEEQIERLEDAGDDQVDRIDNKASEIVSQLTTAAEVRDVVADAFSTSKSYAVGDYCFHEDANQVNKLYKFIIAHPAGNWIGPTGTGADVVEVKLANDVTDLKSALYGFPDSITGSTGVTPYVFELHSYYRTQDTGNAVEKIVSSDTVYGSILIPVQEGDVVTICGKAETGVKRLFVFIDENGNSKGRSNINLDGVYTATAPAGAVYLAVNNNFATKPSGAYAYKGKSLSYAFKNISALDETDNLNNIVKTGWYYWTSTHVPTNAPVTATGKMLVFNRTDSDVAQIVYANTATRAIEYMRTKSRDGWNEWRRIIQDIDQQDAVNKIENEIFFPYLDFENGNINSSGKSSSGSTHPLRTGFIPVDEFVRVDVTGDDGEGNNYVYQLFAYDINFEYLGYGNSSRHSSVSTRDDVLTAYPTTKYVRIKISGGPSSSDLDVDDLSDYGYEGYVRLTRNSVNQGGSNEYPDIMSLIEVHSDENGQYTEDFIVDFELKNVPMILTIAAQYTGEEAPTIRIINSNPNTDYSFWGSFTYDIGGTREHTRKSWRIPQSSAVYTHGKLVFTIPEGTALIIRNADLKGDQRNRYNDLGIKFHGHTGAIAPDNTVEAFQIGAELGYNSMITIPKFTTDGTGVCFHDDGKISNSLRWIDGTSITGEDDKGISQYSYDYITENFRIKETVWGILHVPTLDEYFKVCSLTGMAPIMSVHSSGFGMSWADGFAEIKRLAKKWNVLNKLGIKSGNYTVQSAARSVFGTDIDCYIFINGQTHEPNSQLGIAKNAGFVESTATDLSGCPYKLISEYFFTQTVSSPEYTGTYYTQTMASISESLSLGFIISIAEAKYDDNEHNIHVRMTGSDINRLINLGVTEFTVDSHISMGLDW